MKPTVSNIIIQVPSTAHIKKMKFGQVALLGALSVAEALEDLKCHQCYGTSVQNCIDSGTVVTCGKNQESCMLTERKRNGVVIRVRHY